MKLQLQSIDRTFTRNISDETKAKTAAARKASTSDLRFVMGTSGPKGDKKPTGKFSLSPLSMETLNVQSENGIGFATDGSNFYLTVLAGDKAQALKPSSKGAKKSRVFTYPDVQEALANAGIIDANPEVGYSKSFDLTKVEMTDEEAAEQEIVAAYTITVEAPKDNSSDQTSNDEVEELETAEVDNDDYN